MCTLWDGLAEDNGRGFWGFAGEGESVLVKTPRAAAITGPIIAMPRPIVAFVWFWKELGRARGCSIERS